MNQVVLFLNKCGPYDYERLLVDKADWPRTKEVLKDLTVFLYQQAGKLDNDETVDIYEWINKKVEIYLNRLIEGNKKGK